MEQNPDRHLWGETKESKRAEGAILWLQMGGGTELGSPIPQQVVAPAGLVVALWSMSSCLGVWFGAGRSVTQPQGSICH